MTRDEYIAWLQDARRAAYRVLLIEIDHAAGTILLGSEDWQSDAADGYRPYDGFLTGTPIITEEIDDLTTVGDVTAIDAYDDGWVGLTVRGYPVRLYVGDRDWPRADFQLVTEQLCDACEAIDGRECRFDVSTAGSLFERAPFGDETLSGTAQSVINSIASDVGAPTPTYTDVAGARLAWSVSLDVTETTKAREALGTIVRSIGAHTRFLEGALDVFVPSSTVELFVAEDDIAGAAIETRSTVPAVARVVVTYGADLEVTRVTGADTGAYDETVTVDAALTGAANAGTLADEVAARYGALRRWREVPLFDAADAVQVGTRLHVTHEDYTGEGVVQWVRREPLSEWSVVEIET